MNANFSETITDWAARTFGSPSAIELVQPGQTDVRAASLSTPERAHLLLDLQRLLHRLRPLARIVGHDGRRRVDDGRAERAGEQADQVLERMDPLLLVQLPAGDAHVRLGVLLQVAGCL